MNARAGGTKRGAARDSLLYLWTLRAETDSEPMTVRVRNLSAGGLMAQCARVFERGERVTVDARGVGLVEGTIAWADGDCVGIAFDRPINPVLARRRVGGGAPTSMIQVAPDGRRPALVPRGSS